MSMLAERRQKKAYILNPRKTQWDAEENNFGRKMMEKMGWSIGRGLGKTEQGMTESIKVKYKNDSKGMGYSGPADCPVQLQDEFSRLLEELNESPDASTLPTNDQVSSLEKRSESSKSRVHYKKFTRGKDLSRYSKKDLECIIGKDALSGIKKTQNSEDNDEEEEDVNGTPVKTKYGVPTTNGGLTVDYFKEKMKAKGISDPTIPKEYDPSEPYKFQPIERSRKKKSKHNFDDLFEKDDHDYNPLALFKKSVQSTTIQEDNIEETIEEPQRKKKKKNKIELEEEAEIPVKSKKCKKNKVKNSIEEVKTSKKNKKSKHKK